MTSGADLFVVCKQCGSEVSPYITECPYCGHRLRRRAPKLPRAQASSRAPARRLAAGGAARRRGRRRRRTRPASRTRGYGSGPLGRRRGPTRRSRSWLPSAAAVGRLARRTAALRSKLAIVGPAARRLVEAVQHASSPTATASTRSSTLLAIAIFGWLLERRHGPRRRAGAVPRGRRRRRARGAARSTRSPIVSGANAGALALLGGLGGARPARRARAARYYEGDLLGAGGDRRAAAGDAVRDQPFSADELDLIGSAASWLAGVLRGRDRAARRAGPVPAPGHGALAASL